MKLEEKRKYHREYMRKRRLRNSDSDKAYRRRWNQLNKEKNRADNLKRKFGLTIEEYNIMLEKQGGVCAICGNVETTRKNNSQEIRQLAVDHDHNTGKIRGLLCHKCNLQLGHYEKVKPDIEKFEAYLKDGVKL